MKYMQVTRVVGVVLLLALSITICAFGETVCAEYEEYELRRTAKLTREANERKQQVYDAMNAVYSYAQNSVDGEAMPDWYGGQYREYNGERLVIKLVSGHEERESTLLEKAQKYLPPERVRVEYTDRSYTDLEELREWVLDKIDLRYIGAPKPELEWEVAYMPTAAATYEIDEKRGKVMIWVAEDYELCAPDGGEDISEVSEHPHIVIEYEAQGFDWGEYYNER